MPEQDRPTSDMTFLLLGDVRINGPWQGRLTVGGRKVLALLLTAGTTNGMHVSSIADHLWGPAQPASGHQMVRSHIMSLRMALPPEKARITHSRASGYRIHHDPHDVDAHLFERKALHGRDLMRTSRYQAAIDHLESALRLWRSGSALADVQDVLTLQGQTMRLQELRLQAEESLAEARLQSRLGDAQVLVPGLIQLAHLHPFRERLIAHLMIALHASGRRVEALDVYTRTRRRFVEDAGIEPTEFLQRIHSAILNGEEYSSILKGSSNLEQCAD